MKFPSKLNIGSGKSFRDDCLNLDIDPSWDPDIVFDLNLPLLENGQRVFTADRFGEISITKNTFDKILAHDVLEHLRDLPTAMGNCLDILKMDGVFEILVPYDLSHGAWQDPSHIRAFNERSWLYYTEWSWYLGWDEARFKVDKLNFQLSPYGKELATKMNLDEVIRHPRAADAMIVSLRKIELSNEDHQKLKAFRARKKPI